MLRPLARGRTSFAAVSIAERIAEVELRQAGARGFAALARIASVPFAALAAAIAGAVFVVLLPVCGIASIAEGISRSCWRRVRDGLTHPRRGVPTQD